MHLSIVVQMVDIQLLFVASTWLYQGCYGCARAVVKNRPTEKYINYVMARVKMLQFFNIKVFIFASLYAFMYVCCFTYRIPLFASHEGHLCLRRFATTAESGHE